MYSYQKMEDENPLFQFTTDSNLIYIVSFRQVSFQNEYFNKLFIIDFAEVNQKKNLQDKGVEQTIVKIVFDFFKNHPKAILHYICDSLDGRDVSRNRLFKKWFTKNNDKQFSNLTINFPTEDLDYTLQFIYKTEDFNLDELQERVLQQLDDFSEGKM